DSQVRPQPATRVTGIAIRSAVVGKSVYGGSVTHRCQYVRSRGDVVVECSDDVGLSRIATEHVTTVETELNRVLPAAYRFLRCRKTVTRVVACWIVRLDKHV